VSSSGHEPRGKPVELADAAAARSAPAAEAAGRAWWRRLPRLLVAPEEVFRALRSDDEADVEGRSEPILAIVLLAGMAGIVLTPAWGTLLDEPTVDGLVVAVVTFVGGLMYGAAGYYLLGLVVWLGAKGMGATEPYRLARQVVGLAALPLALSLFVTVPLAVLLFGGDWLRTGGSDEGVAGWIVLGLGLGAVAWSAALLVVGLRATFRLPWRGVAGALALAAVLLAALAVLPSAL
jgi:hypothetical protein